MTNHENVLNPTFLDSMDESSAPGLTGKTFDPGTRHYYEQFTPEQLIDFLLQRDEHIAELTEQMEAIGAGGVSLMDAAVKPADRPCPPDRQTAHNSYSPALTDTQIDQHLDQILVASGSSLRNYSMQHTIDRMRAAMSDVERAAVEAYQRRLTVFAYATHHDEPMIFPTFKEAAVFCDVDEEPIPLLIESAGR